jgi:anti-sigma factor RsiW
MSDCERARALLLEADIEELRGEGDSPLATHLRGCEACQATARSILMGQVELDRALAELARPAPEARVLPLRRGTAWRWAAWPAPLAAAAAVALLLITRGAPAPEKHPVATAEAIAKALFPRPPMARAEGGRSVAVLKTSDPGITVVWIY